MDRPHRPLVRVAFALCACLSAARCGGVPPASALAPPALATSLPVEVLGLPTTEVTVALELPKSAPLQTEPAELELTVQNVLAPDAAELSVNGGAPVDLGDPNGPLFSRVGHVRQGRLALAAGALRAGTNHLTFRYTRQLFDGQAAVSGFRVLGLSLHVQGARYAPDLPLAQPSTWRPGRDDPAALERGRRYFQEESRDEGPACGRCHADSGADLQYYAFSDVSIVARAMHHRFSREEAEELASYIRSLDVPRLGRPEAPPFQPGPGNLEAAGAGPGAHLAADGAFAASTFAEGRFPEAPGWDWAAQRDTFILPAPVALPTWARWLPRRLDGDWFTREDGALARSEAALASDPSLENARAFMSAAMRIAKELLQERGDYEGKIELLRFAAVKLWDWSRRHGFSRPDRGVLDGGPAYPYEVGFAFFEAAQAGARVPDASAQTMSWWWLQLSANPGRGHSDGNRPLNFADVLTAAEGAGAGPSALAFLHLYGSWEESRGPAAAKYGTHEGPVRLLEVPLRALAAPERTAVLRRFLAQERVFLGQGGALTEDHQAAFARAWSTACAALSDEQRALVRAEAPSPLADELGPCP